MTIGQSERIEDHMYEVRHVKGVGFQVFNTETDHVLMRSFTRRSAQAEADYQNRCAENLAAKPRFNPYVEADAPGGLNAARDAKSEIVAGMAFEETGRDLTGKTVTRCWFVRKAGPKQVEYDYADSNMSGFESFRLHRDGLRGRMTRAEFDRIVGHPDVTRIDANAGDGLALLDELAETDAKLNATLAAIDAKQMPCPHCRMCKSVAVHADGPPICPRCGKILIYCFDVSATFVGFQGRNAVLKDRDGHEFVVWAEVFDGDSRASTLSKKGAAMNALDTPQTSLLDDYNALLLDAGDQRPGRPDYAERRRYLDTMGGWYFDMDDMTLPPEGIVLLRRGPNHPTASLRRG